MPVALVNWFYHNRRLYLSKDDARRLIDAILKREGGSLNAIVYHRNGYGAFIPLSPFLFNLLIQRYDFFIDGKKFTFVWSHKTFSYRQIEKLEREEVIRRRNENEMLRQCLAEEEARDRHEEARGCTQPFCERSRLEKKTVRQYGIDKERVARVNMEKSTHTTHSSSKFIETVTPLAPPGMDSTQLTVGASALEAMFSPTVSVTHLSSAASELCSSLDNTQDSMQRMDSTKANCNQRCQTPLGNGNDSSRLTSCFRHECECHGVFKCISACGCDICYECVPPAKRLSLGGRRALDREIFGHEKLTFKQLTSTEYDDALDAYNRSDDFVDYEDKSSDEHDEEDFKMKAEKNSKDGYNDHDDCEDDGSDGDEEDSDEEDDKIGKKRRTEYYEIRRSKRIRGIEKDYALSERSSEEVEVTNAVSVYTEKEFMETHQDFCAKCGHDGFDHELYL